MLSEHLAFAGLGLAAGICLRRIGLTFQDMSGPTGSQHGENLV